MTPFAPPGSVPPPGSGAGDGEHRPRSSRQRILTLIIVVLLIAIPAGYLVISAFQSRDSGEDKQRGAAAEGLTYDWPSRVQRRTYEVPIPQKSTRVGFYEQNSWQTSSLYVQFRTSPKRLDAFLDELGEGSELRNGRAVITEKQAETVGWNLQRDGHSYAGATFEQPGSRPDRAVMVDTTQKQRPQVYVVSTTEF